MSPRRIFLLLLVFMALFTGLHYVKPLERYFPSMEEFVPDHIVEYVKGNKRTTLQHEPHTLNDTLLNSVPDTVTVNERLPVVPDSLYGRGNQVRIMYYGDSQIEGDRFSSYLRHSLQERFSGSGPGLFLPVMPVMYTRSVNVTSSSNWERYNYMSYRNGDISHTGFGPMLAMCRYLPEGTVAEDSVTATVTVKPSVYADSLSSRYCNLRLFYRNTEGAVAFSVKADNEYVFRTALDTSASVSEVVCHPGSAKDITLEFKGTVSPDILGISIESAAGAVVDNIPQRGSAGLEFTMTDRRSMAEAYNMLLPDLFIMQYGLNVATNVKGEYTNYRKGIERQIALLKQIAPAAAVLVIGVTDIASGEGGTVRSYRNIPAVIGAQQAAAEAAGAHFWNSYEAMGGDSSIIRWALLSPPLAQKDHVHFTDAGADTLAHRLVREMFAYSNTVSAETHTQHDIAAPAATGNTIVEPAKPCIINKIIDSIIKHDRNRPMIFSSPAFWVFLLSVIA
ncbi:MAG: hypothetical protein LBV26_08325, partial [Bacteroidales bacterium]|nr:hypothetical protein [Bacteroidales bacterium]